MGVSIDVASEESPVECYICTGSEPRPWRSGCLCTDRYIHEECLKKLLQTQGNPAEAPRCPACASPFSNVQHVVVTRVAFSSRGVWLWIYVLLTVSLGACALNTGLLAYYHTDGPNSKARAILVTSTIFFATVSALGSSFWIAALWRNGAAILRETCLVKKGRFKIVAPLPLAEVELGELASESE